MGVIPVLPGALSFDTVLMKDPVHLLKRVFQELNFQFVRFSGFNFGNTVF